MATAALITVEEYLETSYEPDREYIDGQVLERNLGEYPHSRLQTCLAAWLLRNERDRKIRVLVEQRVRISRTRFRIPDVCVISRDAAIEPVITYPPPACIEVLSKDDRLRSIEDKVDDYTALGVPAIWLFDPLKRQAFVCTPRGLLAPENGILAIPGTPIELPLQEIFADLD